MSALSKIIREKMHQRNLIDNGLSEDLEAIILPLLNTAINDSLNTAEYSSRVLQGMLASGDYVTQGSDWMVEESLQITSKLLHQISNPERLFH